MKLKAVLLSAALTVFAALTFRARVTCFITEGA